MVIGYETKTIAVVYFVFAITFIFMFYRINPVINLILGSILILLSLRIFLIPWTTRKYEKRWTAVLDSFSDEKDAK